MHGLSDKEETKVSYYDDHSRISNSMLSCLKRSPALFKQRYIDGVESEPSKDMLFGSLLHAMVLEPETVAARYAIAPQVDRRTKEGKAVYNDFLFSLDHRTAVDAETFAQARDCANALCDHPEFEYATSSLVEQPIEFDWFGTPCKAKPDLIDLENAIIWDVKTSQSASPESFARSVVEYGYHRQSVFYREAVLQQYGVMCRFIFAVVAKSEPIEFGLYELDNVATDVGSVEVQQLVDEYEERKQKNDWVSTWSKGVNSLALPRWYRIHQSEVIE